MSIEKALADVAAGRPVLVVDDEDRENEGDLIFAAELATPALMAFMVRHSSGFVCVALPEPECGRLDLAPMHHANGDRFGTAYRVTVDAAVGVGTGISARDRAHTARLLAGADAGPRSFTRPGHVVPLAARTGGVLERAGHTEAAVDLAQLAGLRPAGVLCEVVSTREVGRMAGRDELASFVATHGLTMITIAELVAYRRAREPQVERVATVRLPTPAGTMRTVGYRALTEGSEHLALVAGVVDGGFDVPVYVHVECVLGDVFGSLRCGCARRLDAALRTVGAQGRGVVVYLRPSHHSPVRGCGDPGPVRDLADHVLRDLGVRSVRPLWTTPAMAPVA